MASEETVYGAMTTSVTSETSLNALGIGGPVGSAPTSSSTGDAQMSSHDSHAVMNDKVQSMAGSIYEELERMIAKYDHDVVKNLMPLIVNVLENLDLSFTETQELEVEVELLKEDNEQLVTQYEREKQLRKGTDQKLLEVEDHAEGDRKDASGKIDGLTSIVKMFELKAKNSQDHISRLEDKENEMKKEYTKLHERYSELFKTHIDYMERTKSILGTEKLDQLQQGMGASRPKIGGMALNQLNRSSGPVSFGYSELENNNGQQASILSDFASQTTPGMDKAPTSLKNELATPTEDDNNKKRRVGAWVTTSPGSDQVLDLEIEEAEDISQDPSIGPVSPLLAPMSKSQTKTETRTGNNLYQELSFQDSEALGDVDEGADITGMGKEVENLITENNELLATKNALNIVKDDLIAKVDELTGEHEILREEIKSLQGVRARLEKRTQELEEELKRVKEEAEKHAKASKTDGDEEVPMAQRKRFTRVEMARVLMERNQYKERFMELQEAVRWTEMIRASRTEPVTGDKKSNKGIWKFFGNLFSGSERLGDPMGPYVHMKYSGSQEDVAPALSTMRAISSAERKAIRTSTDVYDGDTISTDKPGTARRSNERKEQYKQVRAHVKKEDGRVQAYGWSLPANKPVQTTTTTSTTPSHEDQGRPSVPVPVPVYCRPLMEKEPGMKIWCAAGVDMSGGRTPDGGSIVGASVFYHDVPLSDHNKKPTSAANNSDDLSALDSELSAGKSHVEEATKVQQQLSSLVWICTSTHAISKVTVIDANSPADVLESFHVCSSHLLCIASVPGAKEDDYRVDEELNQLVVEESELREQDEARRRARRASTGIPETEEDFGSGIGAISFVSCATGSERRNEDNKEQASESQPTTEDTDAVHRRFLKDTPAKVKDGVSEVSRQNEIAFSEVEKMSSVLPTMWLGSQSGSIYVHSAVSQWKRCIHSIRLKDSVLAIVHVKGRVMAAMANGTIAIFHRGPDGQWDLANYHLLDLGEPRSSIRCMVQVHNKVWCGYRNKVFVVNPRTMTVDTTLVAHPRKESQVRQMAWIGDGVWVSIRLDSTLRLYHAHTNEHLQDVDIEPYVSKMLGTGKLGFSFVRITSLLVSCNRLWMGTGNGVIISVPLAGPDDHKPTSSQHIAAAIDNTPLRPGSTVRVFADKERLTAETFIPYCSMAQAQLSFHGHRDAVKFFVSVPGHGGLAASSVVSSPGPDAPRCIEGVDSAKSMLVMSGGEGYIDFRIVDDGSDHDFDSHIMVWQVPQGEEQCLDSTTSSSKVGAASSMSPKSSTAVDACSSRASSSIDLGPTPGSGLLTADTSGMSNADSMETVDALHLRRSPSIGKEATESMTASSLTQWGKDVESMLEHGAELEEGDPEEPREDFLQQMTSDNDVTQ